MRCTRARLITGGLCRMPRDHWIYKRTAVKVDRGRNTVSQESSYVMQINLTV
jgi:hypothetical protein